MCSYCPLCDVVAQPENLGLSAALDRLLMMGAEVPPESPEQFFACLAQGSDQVI